MKTFDEIYEELQSIDNKRFRESWEVAKKENEKAKKKAKAICFTMDILVVLLFWRTVITVGGIFLLMFIAFFVLIFNIVIYYLITGFSRTSKNNQKFNARYKELVINRIIENFYTNLEYFPQKKMPEYIYDKIGYEYYEIYDSDDYFEAQIDGKYGIQMAEIETKEEKTHTNSEGETETELITKFHGLFAKVVMDKSINSELKILENGKFRLNNRLNMDSSEFEKYFDVKASDPIIGMQLLTADVMQDLVEFENKTKMKFDIVIKNNELYLRFHSGTMFEYLDFSKGLFDKETLKKYFYMLNFTYNLSKKMINVVNDVQV